MNNIAYIALGTNQGDRENFLLTAIKLLDDSPCISLIEHSSIFETEPVGYTEQPKFLNMVVKIRTSLTANELLELTQKLEKDLGRKREIHWGPRTIDLDILLFNDENIESEHLKVPHPRMFERAFVIIPLLEINKEILNQYKINADSLTEDKGVSLYIERERVLRL